MLALMRLVVQFSGHSACINVDHKSVFLSYWDKIKIKQLLTDISLQILMQVITRKKNRLCRCDKLNAFFLFL